MKFYCSRLSSSEVVVQAVSDVSKLVILYVIYEGLLTNTDLLHELIL